MDVAAPTAAKAEEVVEVRDVSSFGLRPAILPEDYRSTVSVPPASAVRNPETRNTASLDIRPDSPVASSFKPSPLQLLAVRLNGREVEGLLAVRVEGKSFRVAATDLGKIGVRIDGEEIGPEGLVDLASLPDMKVDYSAAEQQIDLQVAPLRLRSQVVDLASDRHGVEAQRSMVGLALQYDMSLAYTRSQNGISRTEGDGSATAFVFSPYGVLSNSWIGHQAPERSYAHRLDTTFEITEPGSLRRWSFGDGVTGALSWSRGVRFGGIQLASDFSLRPELMTFPLPSFFGQSAVPGAIDVLVNSTRVYEGSVDPGPFELKNIPVFVGQGDVRVTLRDITGREVVQSIPFFTGGQLLRKGLTSYSLDVGYERVGYGVRSFDYGKPLASVSLRRGITDQLTLETHFEVGGGVALGGGGFAASIGSLGLVYGAAAFSRSDAGDGELANLGGQIEIGNFSLYGDWSKTFGDFRDVASLSSPDVAQESLRIGSSYAMGRDRSLSLGWLQRLGASDETETRVLTASYTQNVRRTWNFGFSLLYDDGNKDTSAGLFLHVPLGDNRWSSASLDQSGGNSVGRLTYAKAPGLEDDLAYSVSLTQGNRPALNGSLQWSGDTALVRGDMQIDPGGVSVRGGASGALVVLRGRVYPAARGDGSFALIETGRPNVSVYREHRKVATTGKDGSVLLGGLVPYAANQIEVDQSDFPLSASLDDPVQVVVPPKRAAVDVNFKAKSDTGTLARLVRPDHSPVPRGALGRIDKEPGSPIYPVASDGRVYFQSLTKGMILNVTWNGGSCSAKVEMPGSASVPGAIPDLGEIVCQ